MGSSWSGFVPQNDIVRLQWAMLEASQKETAAKMLSLFLGKNSAAEAEETPDDPEDEIWHARELAFRPAKVK